ncbi:MAG: PAS domain-containing protein [Nitrospirae bacterium]|nr:PAS domain-containing protein [Nitrospirota bacterium]
MQRLYSGTYSIKTVTTGLVTVIFMLFASLLIINLTSEKIRQFRDDFMHEQTVKAQLLAISIGDAVENGDYAGLQKFVSILKDDPDVAGLVVNDSGGNPMANFCKCGAEHVSKESLFLKGSSVVNISRRLTGRNNVYIGEVNLSITLEGLEASIRKGVLVNIVVVLVLGSVCMGLMLFFFDRLITVPIGSLGKAVAAQAGSAGKKPEIPYQNRQDEIGGLARTAYSVFAELAGTTDSLRTSEERLKAIIDNSPSVVCLKDTAGKYVLVNRRFQTLFHLSNEQAAGKGDHEIFEADIAAEILRNDGKVLDAGTPLEFEEFFRQDDGMHLYLSTRFPLIDAGGAAYAICVISTDITGRRRAEEEKRELEFRFLHSQKLESVGRLASGVAHDFNNMLSGIIGFSELSLRKVSSEDPVHKFLRQINRAGKQAASLTKQLLAFSRKQILEMKPVDINLVVENMSRMLKRIIGDDVVLDMNLGEPVNAVNADHLQIEQTILNLAVNARDAMPGGGRLVIETANVRSGDERLRRLGVDDSGDYVMLAVTDTGEGIPPDAMEKIFEPFFTTKEMGKGTGLGLSTVYGIVQQHGGQISIESEPGKGTVFRIYLPSCGGVIAETVMNDDVSCAGGSETILVVDNSPVIRELAAAVLEPLGYRVFVAGSGEEALWLIDAANVAVHVLLTASVLPGMNGSQLAEAVQIRLPLAVVLFLADEADGSGGCSDATPAIGHIMMKPLGHRDLACKIREALDATGRNMPDKL